MDVEHDMSKVIFGNGLTTVVMPPERAAQFQRWLIAQDETLVARPDGTYWWPPARVSQIPPALGEAHKHEHLRVVSPDE